MKRLVLLLALAACSKTETRYIEVEEPTDASVTPGVDAGPGLLSIRPAVAYSGHDGTHAFVVPIAVYGAGADLQVSGATLEPKELVSGAGDSGKWFFVDVTAPGELTLTATSGGRTATSKVVVTSYPAARWAAGEARYQNGASGDPPCTQCHGGGDGIDHTPAALAGAADEALAATITTGIAPNNVVIRIDGEPGHAWKVSDAERDGLVTYLRSLPPKGFR